MLNSTIKTCILLITSFSLSHAQISVNGVSIAEDGGGRPQGCSPGTYKPKSPAITNGSCIDLTQDYSNFLSGAFWYCTQIDLNESFLLNFDVSFGSDVNGGDGLAFVLQNEDVSDVKGGAGGGLGYAQGNNSGCLGGGCPITPSIAIEMDTWDNSDIGINDIACHHASIQTNGQTWPANTLIGPSCLLSSGAGVVDGATHTGCISWDPSLNELTLYFDGSAVLTYFGNIRTTIGSNLVWWGFTAASGGVPQVHQVCNMTLVTGISNPDCALVLSNGQVDLTSSCSDNKATIQWEHTLNSDDLEVNHFVLQYSNDGILFSDVEEIPSYNINGQSYSHQFSGEFKKGYARIKSLMADGTANISKTVHFECSDIRQVDWISCYPNPTEHSVTLQTLDKSIEMIEVVSLTGVSLKRYTSISENQFTVDLSDLKAGSYMIRCVSDQTKWIRIVKI